MLLEKQYTAYLFFTFCDKVQHHKESFNKAVW